MTSTPTSCCSGQGEGLGAGSPEGTEWTVPPLSTVADLGFDLRGGVDFVKGGGRKSLKVLTVEVKSHFQRVFAIFLIKLGLKLIASEASKEKIEKI